ncbi:MAG TPA: IS110 family transposase [Mycobacterium sp.]|nr:IS110 family transposase [Mycobacterium sp.]
MSEYDGKQFVGIDLHRRRSVLVRTTNAGEALEVARVSNDVDSLARVIARAGQAPQVVLEATYGWYWAADALRDAGAVVHLAHPLGVKMFEHRRVKNDVRDATDLADLLRMGRLPEAWIAPPGTREVRELVRHRAKLVTLRTGAKNQVHAVLAKLGVQVPMSDLFADRGQQLLARVAAPAPYVARLQSLQRIINDLDEEIDLFARLAKGKLIADPGYRAVQTIPGIGPVLAAVFVAEIGDVTRFTSAAHLASWAGLTPKHHESDTHVHRGRITKQGSRLVRWAAVESVKRLGPRTGVGAVKAAVAARRNVQGGKNIATVAAARRQIEHVYYAMRDGHVRALPAPVGRHPTRPPARGPAVRGRARGAA